MYMRRKKERLNPEGTKKFTYGRPSNRPTDKQRFLIDVIEFAYNDRGIRFTGNTTKEAYDFIGRYYPTVEYDASNTSVYRIENGNSIFIGYMQNQFAF